MKWKLAVAAALAAVLIVATRSCLPPPTPNPPGTFSFAVLGDAPYYPWEEPRFRLVLRHIDAHDVRFVVHVGDIFWHPCTDENYAEVLRRFNGMRAPVIYTPGDNEWTDCWENDSGAFAPRERLQRIRQMFFANPHRSLGRNTLLLASEGPEFVENARWRSGNAIFATVNLPGSRNAMKPFPGRTAADDAEVRRRTDAAAAWARATFAEARATNASAVVFAFQANPGFERPAYRAYFEPFIATVEEEAERFGKPVLLAHGDGHEYIVDHPLRLKNVTRMQVPGSPRVGWVRVFVTPDGRFTFSQTVLPFWWKVW